MIAEESNVDRITIGLGPSSAAGTEAAIRAADAQHWRDRAEEARTHAEQMNTADARMMMLGIAENYEKLARRAEQRAQKPAATAG